MKIRIIRSKECPTCTAYLRQIEKIEGFPEHELYNADAEGNQDQLDKWMVTDMPVLQIVEDNKVLHQFLPGPICSRSLNHMMEKIKKRMQ